MDVLRKQQQMWHDFLDKRKQFDRNRVVACLSDLRSFQLYNDSNCYFLTVTRGPSHMGHYVNCHNKLKMPIVIDAIAIFPIGYKFHEQKRINP